LPDALKRFQRLCLYSLLLSPQTLLALDIHRSGQAVSERISAAQRLSGDLTPLGAIRSGNQSDIPPWRGGVRMPPPPDDRHSVAGYPLAVYADDQPLLSVDGRNWQQYAAYLSVGQQALFLRYPDTFRMLIYPTRRTAAAPERVYDAIYKNSIRVDLNRNGMVGLYALGGIPFPQADSGVELIWNHLARWRGAGWQGSVVDWQPTSNGWQSLQWQVTEQIPFYTDATRRPEESERLFARYWQTKNLSITEQADTRTGVQRTENGQWPEGWQQHFPAADDHDMFSGSPSDYVWQLLGQKEIFIPYNIDPQHLPGIIPGGHPETDAIRYEKHRVYVVDGVLRKNARNPYPKRVFYIDEDSSSIVLADQYNSDGLLWRLNMALPVCWYDTPALVSLAEISFDLLSGQYALSRWPPMQSSGQAATP
jgi:hypothetical protein